MARFRLQIQLQEIDLVRGETLLGRGPGCNVTIEDPLVSREHALIVVDDDEAVIRDLGSRNGVCVNGEVLVGARTLRHRDRIRIGLQEFVFHALSPSILSRLGKATSSLRLCESCGCPYSDGCAVCPTCGHEKNDEDDHPTLTVPGGEGPVASWTIQLLLELMDRALAVGNWDESARVLFRASVAVDDHLESNAVDLAVFEKFLTGASRIAYVLQEERWAKWIVDSCAKAKCLPSPDVTARLRTIPLRNHSALVQSIDALLKGCSVSKEQDESAAGAIEQWRSQLSSQG